MDRVLSDWMCRHKSAQSGRGSHPDITVLDEADFARTFFTVILPLMSETGHVLLAASSPNVAGGAFTNVIFAKDSDGNTLMNSVILGEPCDVCKATPNPEACSHKSEELATWKDPKRMARLAEIYRAVDASDILMSELHTMPRLSDSSVFGANLYSYIGASPPKPSSAKIRVVYIGVDPAAGGKCEFSVCALGQSIDPFKFEVIFTCNERLSSGEQKMDQVRAIVDGCIESLRKHPRVGYGVPMIVAIEACNLADAVYIAPMFIDHNIVEDTVFVMAEFAGKRDYGVPKNPRITSCLVTAASLLLNMRAVTIPDDSICYSTRFAESKVALRDYIASLMMQLANFKLDLATGKVSGKSGGNNDDKTIAFLMPMFWCSKFCANINPDYLDFKSRFDPSIWLDASFNGIIDSTRKPKCGGGGGSFEYASQMGFFD